MIQKVKMAYWPQLAAFIMWFGTAFLTYFIKNADDFPRTTEFTCLCIIIAVFCVVTLPFNKVRYYGPWLLALALITGGWEIVQAKWLLLPRPFLVHHRNCWMYS